MSSAEVIDALFDRTVDVVQSLPKSGPIQTSYEEKLALYSLYKQATDGNVTSKRPGMLDMLGRAKWDAWAGREGMDSLDAKQLYVESMMRILRKFGDRPQARELIEELETFSGDVAERVMRGALDTDDTASETSSAPAPLRHRVQRVESDDEAHDRLSSLRPSGSGQQAPSTSTARRRQIPLTQRYSQTSSVGGASIMAAHGGRTGVSGGSSTPQRRHAQSGDSDEDDDFVERPAPLPSSSSAAGLRGSTGQGAGYRQGRSGPSGPPSSVGGGSQRPPASAQGTYAPSNRYHPPPRSESNAGTAAGDGSTMGGGGGDGRATGGAGASLYSAVGPSRPPPAPIEHHYYHRASDAGRGAQSSVGGRSANGRGGGAAPAPAASSSQKEVDQALQSIQASLAALHERLNRVEGSPSNASNRAGAHSGSGTYRALSDAMHDIAVLLGLASSSSGSHAAAPTFGATSTATTASTRSTQRRWAPLSLILSLINLALRLTLDVTSLGILATVLLFLFRRITGRGDPLVLLRLAQRVLGRRGRDQAQRAVSAAASAVS